MTVKRWMLISMVVLSLTGIVLASSFFPSLRLAPTQPQDSLSKSTTVYAYGPSGLLSKQVGGEVSYYHTDYLSSSALVTDSGGARVYYSDYEPFGSSLHEQGEERYTYTGKELDSSTGLYYYGARYYDASVGRFVSVDPVQGSLYSGQRLNRYTYVLNNPMVYVDVNGEDILFQNDQLDYANQLVGEINEIFGVDIVGLEGNRMTLSNYLFREKKPSEVYRSALYDLLSPVVSGKWGTVNMNFVFDGSGSTAGLGDTIILDPIEGERCLPLGECGGLISLGPASVIFFHELRHYAGGVNRMSSHSKWSTLERGSGLIGDGEQYAVQYENYARALTGEDRRVYYKDWLLKENIEDPEESSLGIGLFTGESYDAMSREGKFDLDTKLDYMDLFISSD